MCSYGWNRASDIVSRRRGTLNANLEGATLHAGLWRSDEQTFPYPFTADETIHALEGELVIDLVDSGEQVVLEPGATTRDIADMLELSVNTIRTYTQSLMTRLDAHTRVQAIVRAQQMGLI